MLVAALAFGLVPQPAAGTFQARFDLANNLTGPVDVAVDGDGNIFVLELWGAKVKKFAASGAFIKEWGAAGSALGQFNQPNAIAVDSIGSVYVAEYSGARVQKFTGTGGFLTWWGGAGSADGQFTNPAGIAVDAADRVYVADSSANRIQKFTATGGFLAKWGSAGAAQGQFNQPRGVAVDAGNVYVVDAGNHRVQKFSLAGVHRQTWGTSGSGDGQFVDPVGIAVDHEKRIFVSDPGSDRIQRFTAAGGHLASFGSNGTGLGQMYDGHGLDVSDEGMLYVADVTVDRVIRFRAVPPDTTSKGPSGLIRDATPTFKLTSSQTPATFQCRLRGSGIGFKPCAATYTTPELDDGLHILLVRAVDSHGLVDPSPAEAEFRVDATPPQTWFDSGPGSTTKDRTPRFTFSSSERGTFRCSLDGTTFKACTSPHTTGTLSYGKHTFRVRAVDRAGNADPTPAVRAFTVAS